MIANALAFAMSTDAATAPDTPLVEEPPPRSASRGRSRVDFYHVAIWSVVALGVGLRLAQYLYDRALWLDEAFLTLNLLGKPFGDLFGQLSFNQAAPPGFLMGERGAVELFGGSEYAVRLLPLACGIASVFLFKHVACLILNRSAALVALTLFSLSDGLIYYSAEVKQYSTDVFALLVVTVAVLDLLQGRRSRRRSLLWAAAGPAAVFMSHPAAFVVASGVAVLIAPDIIRARWHHLRANLAVPLTWTAFLLFALVYYRSRVSYLLSTYEDWSGNDDQVVFPAELTFFRNFAGGLVDALGVPASGLAQDARYPIAVVAIVGSISLARRAGRQWMLLTLPAGAVVVAAALQTYPVLPRTILFLLPMVAIVGGEGVSALSALFREHQTAAAVALGLAVCAIPAAHAAEHVVDPRQREEIKPVLRRLAADWRPGDALYIFYRAQYALRYYSECGCFEPLDNHPLRSIPRVRDPGVAQYARALRSEPPNIVAAARQQSRDLYLEKIVPFQGRDRVWVLVTAADPIERSVLAYLSCVGRLDAFFVRDDGEPPFGHAALYRFDLSRWRSPDQGATCPTSGASG